MFDVSVQHAHTHISLSRCICSVSVQHAHTHISPSRCICSVSVQHAHTHLSLSASAQFLFSTRTHTSLSLCICSVSVQHAHTHISPSRCICSVSVQHAHTHLSLSASAQFLFSTRTHTSLSLHLLSFCSVRGREEQSLIQLNRYYVVACFSNFTCKYSQNHSTAIVIILWVFYLISGSIIRIFVQINIL